MTTIKEELTISDFDWESGIIIYQETPDDYSPGWTPNSMIIPGIEIKHTHPILTKNFQTGYGGPQMPRFIAKDNKYIYFPAQYDGSTWIEKIAIDIKNEYINIPTPYPGG